MTAVSLLGALKVRSLANMPPWLLADLRRAGMIEAQIRAWIVPLVIDGDGDGGVIVIAPSRFHKNWVEGAYHPQLCRALGVERIEYVVKVKEQFLTKTLSAPSSHEE